MFGNNGEMFRKLSLGKFHALPRTRLAAFTCGTVILVIFFLYCSLPQISTLTRKPQLSKSAGESKQPPLDWDRKERETSTLAPFVPRPADLCHVVGRNREAPSLWQFNSRSLCLSSSICLRSDAPAEAYFHTADLESTKCVVDTPAFEAAEDQDQDLAEFGSCAELQRKLILCAHGKGLIRDAPICPELLSTEGVELNDSKLVRWFEDVTILVPSYPYPGNIYHFGNVVSWVAHVVDTLPSLLESWGLGNVHATGGNAPYFSAKYVSISKVNVVFRGPQNSNGWQVALLDLMVKHRIASDKRMVELHYLAPENETKHTCIRNAVVLGRRGHVNVWPFPNATSIPLDGLSVPADAVEFKRAVYKAFNITAHLPERSCRRSCTLGLPPLTLGYARRLSASSAVGGNVHGPGTVRRFSEADEEWFISMLRNETSAAGVKLHIFTTSSDESLQAQVTNIVQVGFVVGIHGANLVNAMFMQPFGALLEIFPGKAKSPCYMGGSNSGLAYYRHISSEVATPEESGCGPDDIICSKKLRQRRVKLGKLSDRDRVVDMVQQGLRHLKYLHDSYPTGIPVKYNVDSAYYTADDSQSAGQKRR